MIIVSAYDFSIGFMPIIIYRSIEMTGHYQDVVWRFTFNYF